MMAGRVLVLRGEELGAGELREGREADRAEHAVGVHVLDARLDVPGALADMAVGRRLDAVFVRWPADDRVQAEIRDDAAFVDPGIVAVLHRVHPGGHVLVLGRQMLGEEVGRLDDMVIDAHENQVVKIHPGVPPWVSLWQGVCCGMERVAASPPQSCLFVSFLTVKRLGARVKRGRGRGACVRRCPGMLRFGGGSTIRGLTGVGACKKLPYSQFCKNPLHRGS